MNFKERKQLEENLLKNIYNNLKGELQKIGETSFNYEDFGSEIKVEDNKNYRTIYIFFDENKLSIMLCYEFDSYSFTPYGIQKLSEGNYTFSSYMEKLNIRKYLNDSSEILPELETNMIKPS